MIEKRLAPKSDEVYNFKRNEDLIFKYSEIANN